MISMPLRLRRRVGANPNKAMLPGPIGLELSQQALRMIQLQRSPTGGLSVLDRCTVKYPQSWQSHLSQPKSLQKMIRAALRAHSFCGRQVVAALPAGEVKIMPLAYPKSDKDDGKSIAELLVKRIEDDLDEYVIDFLPVRSNPDDQERLALVAMTRRKRVTEFLDVLTSAGLEVMALDIGPAAINRIFSSVPGASITDTILVINSGHDSSYLTMISGRRLLLDQQVDFSEEMMLKHLSSVLDLTNDAARQLLIDNGFDIGRSQHSDLPFMDSTDITHTLTEILKPLFMKLAETINQVLIYSAAETRGNPVKQIYLLGAIAYWPGADRLLDGLLDIPVLTVNDGLKLAAPTAALGEIDETDRISPDMVVSAGLALRGMDNHA